MIAGIVEEGAGGVAPSGGGASSPVTFIGSHNSDLTASSPTTVIYAAANIGTPAADRVVIIALGASSFDSLFGDVPTCTIAGVTATVASSRQVDSYWSLAYIFYAEIPTGTSGDIVLTLASSWYTVALSVYTATGLSSSVPYDAQGQTAVGIGVDTIASSINVPTNGFALIAGDVEDGDTVIPSGLTTVDLNIEQADLSAQVTGRTTGAGSHSIGLDWTTSSGRVLCSVAAASWG